MHKISTFGSNDSSKQNLMNQIEQHPRLNLSNLTLIESKIILGSFPTWTLTGSDTEKNNQKETERTENGDIPYFYGSSSNRFWIWYKNYIDQSIPIKDISSIEKSLKRNEIGITDVIISCSRKGKSALDKHLTNRTYNFTFFKYPKKGQTLKILCTSKGVMNDMFLSRKFFNIHPHLSINQKESNNFQKKLAPNFNGNLELVRMPFYQEIDVHQGGKIKCFALPSPGSPFRRLIDFGHVADSSDKFLSNYLKTVFDWFNT
ncbi:hypothetical protein [Reichenbachiella sp. MALMAid0571]|uniref:hypothetical protein n=1 Tax=Reichenbachiella sp. MALMAid0571 TaxID=3143939 RepID=UPI0032DEF24A